MYVCCVHVVCLSVSSGIEAHDKEGRIITAEFEKYFFITTCECYPLLERLCLLRNDVFPPTDVPNAGEKLKR